LAEAAQHAEMLANRVRKNDRHLRKWARREEVDCYRVYDRDIPEIPLSIDRYADHLYVARYRSEHRPHTEQTEWLDAMVASARQALDVPAERTHVKLRERTRERDKYAASGHRFTIREGGHSFYVNLDDYLDTGLFLDHRLTRQRVADEARDKRVLNLFCYTGSFTIYAAAAGARSSLSVDNSAVYLRWARDNFDINGLGDAHELHRADVLAFLDDGKRRQGSFDLAVLDPPTFSHGKRMDGVLDIQRDHAALIAKTLRLLRTGGVLYFSTNARRFKLDATTIANAEIEDITNATIPPDFRNARPHRCWRLVKTPG
jgi:23S rRNA G2069 N7-methylase RlmK/C1962 C5-methylase RlmI